MNTVMAECYPGTGRPHGFRVIPDDDERVKRLQAFGFIVVATGTNIKSVDAAWDLYTYVDADGYTQWRHD